MTHHTVERLVVRMSYDPAFAEAVRRDDSPLRALGLSEREIGWLRAVDPRAWRHDPMKRRRTLRALCEEFKASAALALRETRRVAFLDGFFSSAAFHDTVQSRGSLAHGFARYLLSAGLKTPQLPDVVRLEATLASCRRALAAAGGPDWKAPPIPPGGPTRVVRAPGVDVKRITPDALVAVQAVERFLFECSLMPIVVLADDAPALELAPPTGAPPVLLGFIPTQSGISLVELEPEVFAAIERAATPVPVDPVSAQLVEDEVLCAVIS